MLTLVFILSVLLVAIAVLLWCLRGFTRTLKQHGFVGVVVRAQDGRLDGPKEQETAQFTQFKDSSVTKSSASPSRKGLLRSRENLAATDARIQVCASATPENGRRLHAVKDAA
jgi:preprotein translocase subunit SecF